MDHFIIKELLERFKKQFTCLGADTKKYITFTVSIKKEVKRIDKNESKLQKIHLPYCNLLIVEDLWLKERFFNTYKFSNHGNNNFIVTRSCLSL